MSTRLEDAEFQDGLLNDWNIHHFHLGAQNPDGSIARTGELLFGMAIRPNTFYALYVGAHGSFADRRLLEIFVNNWPNVADAWRLRGIQPGPTNWNPTPEEIRTARSGMTLMLDINGHFYAPPGGGINTAGTSMSDVVEADRLRFYLRPLSSIIENAEPAIRRHMRDRGLAQKETLALAMVELTFYPIRVYLEEVTTGFRFFLNIP
jgi:hypothetical protein